ncbi:MAG: hypothetical protein L6Q37_14510 [Bdellovibrionaceae bacterium]|nr:hypothetical protein [Pseudobdellovibrionaceae bacterium]NUM60383.1 hypothetical protein [Pseudobdellovibrionaceae bacterium]
MKMLITSFRKVFQLKQNLILLLFLFFVNSLFEQFLIQKLEQILKSQSNFQLQLFLYGGLNILSSILFPIAISILTLFFFKNPSSLFFVHIRLRDIESLLIETLRSWGKTMWWGFLFILPGFYKFLSYSFVPFVVLLDNDYSLGKKEALAESSRIFKERWAISLLALIIFQLILPLMLSSLLDSYRNFEDTPLPALLSSAIQGILSLWGFLLLMEIYLKQRPLKAF